MSDSNSTSEPKTRLQWFDLRFIENDKKVKTHCKACNRAMWFPPSKSGKYLTCGNVCAAALRDENKQTRRRECLTCQSIFYPRPRQISTGAGKYCCVACAEPARAAGRTPEVVAKRGALLKLAYADGIHTALRGHLSPKWKGGKDAYKLRRSLKDPIERAEKRRAYLRANPEKSREWSQRRTNSKTGRLPRGTVMGIGVLQKWKCAICKTAIKNGYHVDHVMPLSRGGCHQAANLQLLCASCNVRKSAKDPIKYMQERGFLL